jgi:hypothetical protein
MYGAATDDVCSGDPSFTMASEAPPNFCISREHSSPGLIRTGWPRVHFDQYALERLLRARWAGEGARSCVLQGMADCAVDVLICPSIYLNDEALFAPRDSFSRSRFGYWYASRRQGKVQGEYWRLLSRVLDAQPRIRKLVVLSPLCLVFDPGWTKQLVKSKSRGRLRGRVIVAAIETEFKPRDPVMSPSHAAFRQELLASWAERLLTSPTSKDTGAPLLVTVPYPVGLTRAARWDLSQGEYDAASPRPITLLLAVPTNHLGDK